LPNPERSWNRRSGLGSVDAAEIASCLGHPVDGPLTLLSGGLANVNVRVGPRVVRIHRRDPSITPLEAHLLALPWTCVRVPAVLRVGVGFMVLEYVEHGPVLGTKEHGAAAGAALAEIHALSFATAGNLMPSRDSPSLEVSEPFPDLVGALVEYARGESTSIEEPLRSRMLRLLEGSSATLRGLAGRPVLLHGDFKASNLHWTTDDRLLVLDWEFAYVGSSVSDIGQLMRWDPPAPFVDAFAASYCAHGGRLEDDWQRWAAVFDLINLAGLLQNLAGPDGGDGEAARVRDVRGRIEKTLALFE
jgi:aminoglycoside phosphotransferase (APT) family kinase protein